MTSYLVTHRDMTSNPNLPDLVAELGTFCDGLEEAQLTVERERHLSDLKVYKLVEVATYKQRR
jgi:hypothetical protein